MLLCLLSCASCTSTERVVTVPKLVKVHVPAAFLVKCPPADRRPWNTTRDIVGTASTNAAALATCAAQVDSIRKWSEGNG